MKDLSLNRSARPPRDDRLAPYMHNTAMIGVMITLSGGLRHASEDPNPRPLPRVTLYDFKRRLAAGAPSGVGPVPNALHFAFYLKPFRAPPERAILVPAEHFWWLLLEQDHLLISDRVTHHWTSVARVDRVAERIYFTDEWPDDFLLLEGRNTMGIAARRSPGLSVSKQEFLRVAVGLVTWDTTPLVQNYLTSFPECRKDPDCLIRFGFALLDAENDQLAPMAATLFGQAVMVSRAGSHEQLLAASQAYLSAACGGFAGRRQGRNDVFQAMDMIMRQIMQVHDRGALEAALEPRELCRLGNAAIQSGGLEAALRVLNLAIAKDPEFEDAFWLRGAAHLHAGALKEAAADAHRALALNEAMLGRLRAEYDRTDPRGRTERDWKMAEIRGRERRRDEETAILNAASPHYS